MQGISPNQLSGDPPRSFPHPYPPSSALLSPSCVLAWPGVGPKGSLRFRSIELINYLPNATITSPLGLAAPCPLSGHIPRCVQHLLLHVPFATWLDRHHQHTTHAPIAVTLVAFSPLSSLLPAACPWAHGRRVRVSICRSSDYITALSRLQIVRLPNILQCPTCVCPTRNCHVTLAHEECTQPSCQSEYPEYHQHAIFPLSVGILQTMCAIATVTSM